MKNSRLVLSLLSFLILAGAGSGRLAAQPTPTGPETRVDTLPGDQYPKCPLIGVAPDQSFEIAWGYNGDFPPEIKARHFNAGGSPTDPAEVLVAALDYYPVTLSVDPVSTGFRVLMEVIDDLGAPSKFYRRRIDPGGVPAGAPRPVGIVGTTHWVSPGPGDTLFAGRYDTAPHRLSMQKVDSLGVPTGSVYILNSRPISLQARPRILALPDGGWIAVFTGYSLSGSGAPVLQVIRARRFSAAGVPAGPDFDVTSFPLPAPGVASLSFDFIAASGPGGRFAVAWIVYDASGDAVRFRSFTGAGAPVAPEQTISIEQVLSGPSSLAFDNAGRVLLLWSAGVLHPTLKARLLRPNGTPLGPTFFPPSAASGAFDEPLCGSVAWVGGSWLVTWAAQKRDGSPSAVFLRRFLRQP
ncbi:MAG TPA: hypothetical protein VIJ61_01125 [Thermoanaerobaculia bacterium]